MWGLIRGGGTLYSRRRAPQPEGGVVAFIDLDLDWVEDLDSVVTGFVDVNLDPAVIVGGVDGGWLPLFDETLREGFETHLNG